MCCCPEGWYLVLLKKGTKLFALLLFLSAASVSVKNNLMTLDSRTKATWQMVSATLVGVENPKRTPDEERLLGQKTIAAARGYASASGLLPWSLQSVLTWRPLSHFDEDIRGIKDQLAIEVTEHAAVCSSESRLVLWINVTHLQTSKLPTNKMIVSCGRRTAVVHRHDITTTVGLKGSLWSQQHMQQ
ncbi:hypothetical protein T03_14099 [Trichinella britovi]|uniref:Uncharacterized protein n=1 Tax=Trichinella britovi TaxID=45882 RepID=A0A0V1D2Q8_TRIBR|nr:hypothetical protein T03_14099 [Trichinella britovi]